MVKYFLGEADPTKSNISEGFEEKLPKVVDYFAKLYGEEYRKQYSEKLNNCTYIFVNRHNVNDNVNDEQFRSNLMAEMFKYIKNQWNITDKDYPFDCETFFGSYEWRLIVNIDKLKTKNYIEYRKVLRYFYDALSLKNQFNSFDEFIASDKLDEYIEKIQNELRPLYILANKCVDYCSPTLSKNNFDYILEEAFCEYFRIFYRGPKNKYIDKFFGENDLISDEDKPVICATIKEFCKEYFFEHLNNKNIAEEEFNNLSYDELMDALNLRKFKQQALENLKIFSGMAKNALAESCPEIDKLIIKIALSVVGKTVNLENTQEFFQIHDSLFDYYFNINNSAYAYILQTANEEHKFCVLPQDSDNETVVHELGHVATCFGLSRNYEHKCGLNYVLNNNLYGDCLNEAVTQRGAVIIDRMMRDDGFLIGAEKSCNCRYNCMTALAVEFINSFSKLLKAYNGSSFDELFVSIGENNFMRLNKCLTKIYKLTKYFTLEEMDEATEYWQRIMHPETKHPFVRDMTHVNIAATVKNPSNEVMKEIKTLKEIYDDIVAYQKNAGVGV